jgi:hypothetical protein
MEFDFVYLSPNQGSHPSFASRDMHERDARRTHSPSLGEGPDEDPPIDSKG